MAYKYKEYQLKLVWDYVRNGHYISDLWNKANYAESVGKEMYYQAYVLFGLDKKVFNVKGDEMPKPKQLHAAPNTVKRAKGGSQYVKKVRICSPLEAPDVSMFANTKRPPDEYTNGGYLSLQKKIR